MWKQILKTALEGAWRLESDYVAMRQTVRLKELLDEYQTVSKSLAQSCFQSGALLPDLAHEATLYKGSLSKCLQNYLLELQSMD